MVNLKNGQLTATISTKGAELKSLKNRNREYIWCGNPEFWSGTSPILFPIIGFLKDGKCFIDGKEYNIQKHGFARNMEFSVESLTENSAVFLLKSDFETLKCYPFNFEFRVVFTLNSNSLSVEYKVKNTDDKKMYFSIGAHEAYATEGVIEDYDLIFSEKENFDTMLLNNFLISNKKLHLYSDTNILPLKEEYFKLDTLIFENLNSKSVVLKNRKNGKEVEIDFSNSDYLAIWHVPNAKYICIEPWNGVPDYDNTDYDFTKKTGIICLEANKEYSNIHKINI